MAVHYCGLCRRSAFTGRRHLYSVGHRRRLQEALAQLQEATAAARAAAALADGAAAVRRYDPAEHDGRVWCPCCGRGVRRDGRRGGLALLQAGLMRHLAGPEHRRETARFWRENRAEAALRERCLVPAEEYERFAQALERALAEHQRREEERILQMAADIREAERRQRETVQAALQLQPEPELCAGPSVCRPSTGPEWDSTCAAEQPGPSGMQTGTDLSWTESGMVLTFIGHQETEGKGNVHTGAKPPWLTEEEDGSKQQIGPSYEEFLKHKEKQKLKKLPVERVGANFDHTSQTSINLELNQGKRRKKGDQMKIRHPALLWKG
ncbi:centrosomal AT-AC splicing factor isoform X2 [Poecile atricapillus]|uniref:centrosomal AT-AC splicing factor isoform X2 n=1 Tax=Poecile atricapillus TaxID=48891 RepID=UPI002738E056|nr:centrosomal AT-AC splicing factor isoform X2 [Poecile atricapillus]